MKNRKIPYVPKEDRSQIEDGVKNPIDIKTDMLLIIVFTSGVLTGFGFGWLYWFR